MKITGIVVFYNNRSNEINYLKETRRLEMFPFDLDEINDSSCSLARSMNVFFLDDEINQSPSLLI